MLEDVLEYHPWSRQKPTRLTATVFSARAALIIGVLAALALLWGTATVAYSLPHVVPLLRTVAFAAMSVIGIGLCLVIAYCIPFYRFVTIPAKGLSPGTLMVVGTPSLISTVCPVERTFLHHGIKAREVQVGLTNGSAQTLGIDDDAVIALPNDFFEQLRTPRRDARRSVRAPGDAAQVVMGWLWDMLIERNGDVVPVDDLFARVDTSLRDWHHIEIDRTWFDAGLEEAAELHLLSIITRGLGRHRNDYAELTESGVIATASLARDEGVEVYRGAEERKQIMEIINWGNYINNSPGAAANMGSGTAVGSNSNITEALQTIVERRNDLAATIEDPVERELLREAIDDLDHELGHERPSDKHLRRFTNAVFTITGSALASLLGDAGWSLVEPWMKK